MSSAQYNEDSIKSLDWKEHIRLRPGMYIGKLGDGTSPDDGIYVLIKEVVDNSIDEFVMGHGRQIDITLAEDGRVTVRDFGRGIPLGKLLDCASRINTGAKYDSEAFKKSVGLNGVGIKAVNALSSHFRIQAFRDGKTRAHTFCRGAITSEGKRDLDASDPNGTILEFVPDAELFGSYRFDTDVVRAMLWNYAWLNTGLTLRLNGERFASKNGLLDLLTDKMSAEPLYPIIHLKGTDIEIALTHGNQYGEEYYSFVNGQNTTQGGTHMAAFKEAIVKSIRDFFKKDYDPADVRAGLIAAISVKVEEPVFESQTKTKLGSQTVSPNGVTMRTFVGNFLAEKLDNYLHKNPEAAKAIQEKIVQSEKERKEISGIQKLARERAKKSKIHNRKLRDCRVHRTDEKDKRRMETTLFLTEGDSASGSITKSRDPETQAVFSLKGKPLNVFGLSRKVVYENEEFHLIQAALDIEEELENLRYQRIVLATDADVDGMHIRLLLITFFLQFFPDVIRNGHLFILQTPLFRVRDKKQTFYCYTDRERQQAIAKLGGKPEITRFKGLGEISPDEFRNFIGTTMRLERVNIPAHFTLKQMLEFYMGKNTPERKDFIMRNLIVETDLVEPEPAPAVAAGA